MTLEWPFPHVRCTRCGLDSSTLHPSFRIAHDGWEHRCPDVHPQVGHSRNALEPLEPATAAQPQKERS